MFVVPFIMSDHQLCAKIKDKFIHQESDINALV